MMKHISYFIVFISIAFFTNCEKKDPTISNEEELITTVRYTLSSSGTADVVLTFKDLDGDGGTAPQISSGILKPNTTYTGQLELLNEAANPVENISNEILTEDEDHQFFFTPSSGLNITVEYSDADGNNKPLGLKTKLRTGATSTGKLKVTLRHQPNKSASGVSQGQLANAGGETDIEIEFTINVQ